MRQIFAANRLETDIGVPVFINPPREQLLGLADRSMDKDLRGLAVGSNVYWWDSYYSTHQKMRNQLIQMGVFGEDDFADTGFLTLKSDENSDFWQLFDFSFLRHPQVSKIGFDRMGRIPVKQYPKTPTLQPSNLSALTASVKLAKRLRVEREDGRMIDIMMNPSKSEILAAVDRSQWRELRGLMVDNDIFWWDSAMLIHDVAAQALVNEQGVSDLIDGSYHLYLRPNHNTNVPAYEIIPASSDVLFHPQIQMLGVDPDSGVFPKDNMLLQPQLAHNWYQQLKVARFNWRDFSRGVGTGMLSGVIPLTMTGHEPLNPHQLHQNSPQSVSVQTPTTNPSIPSTLPTTLPASQKAMPASQPATMPSSRPTTEPATAPATQPVRIEIKKIIQIESSGNPKAVSNKGAAGLMQIVPETWNELVRKMGKNWTLEDRFDPQKNVAVGSYYMNTEIPRLLKSFNVPDSTETRLAAYNWGVGSLAKAYKANGERWLDIAPEETRNYIAKYKS